MTDPSRTHLLRLGPELAAWAKELPEPARLGLNDDGQTVEIVGVSFEMRHHLKLLAQHAGVDNPGAIEALLYLELRAKAAKEAAHSGSSRYFHSRRCDRTVYRGSVKGEGYQIVGYFYPLRDALLEYCQSVSAADSDAQARGKGWPDADTTLRGREGIPAEVEPTPEPNSPAAGPDSAAALQTVPDGDSAFASKAVRQDAVAAYAKSWGCSEAGLARTARVDPSDLSKWKRALLCAGSDKGMRIENVLKNNDTPTPAAKRPKQS